MKPSRSKQARHPVASRPRPAAARKSGPTPRYGLARALSKLGACSRARAQALIADGRVRVNGRRARDPDAPTDVLHDRIFVDDVEISAAPRVYLALNKPRGYVTTASDEHARQTVYALLVDAELPWLAPVGRLDQASEGLLLFTNDSTWAARITDPASHLDKTYHVQVAALPDAALLALLRTGTRDRSERLVAKSLRELRRGARNAWLEIVLDEGRNRQIRRLLAAHGIEVLRLIRIAIGPITLGALAKGRWRHLSADEVAGLAAVRDDARHPGRIVDRR